MRLRTFDAYTYGEHTPRGNYHPSRTIDLDASEAPHWDARLLLAAGGGDRVLVYRDLDAPGLVIVATVNDRHGYAGIEIFDREYADRMGVEPGGVVEPFAELFLQHDHEIADALGSRGLELSDVTIARRLTAAVVWP